jgi:hypothetical protein
MGKGGLLQIFTFIYDTVKSELEVWINGDVNGYICRGNIFKKRIFSHRLTWLQLQPTSPFQLPMRVYVPLLYLSLSPSPICVASKA